MADLPFELGERLLDPVDEIEVIQPLDPPVQLVGGDFTRELVELVLKALVPGLDKVLRDGLQEDLRAPEHTLHPGQRVIDNFAQAVIVRGSVVEGIVHLLPILDFQDIALQRVPLQLELGQVLLHGLHVRDEARDLDDHGAARGNVHERRIVRHADLRVLFVPVREAALEDELQRTLRGQNLHLADRGWVHGRLALDLSYVLAPDGVGLHHGGDGRSRAQVELEVGPGTNLVLGESVVGSTEHHCCLPLLNVQVSIFLIVDLSMAHKDIFAMVNIAVLLRLL
mmetsp:Transcript_67497/g.173834  ORF Transcript_67497/g.173834 Transcript_67497/m.173834 type:complete len:282 (-) Transcript_67497:176-1021(-)